MMDTQILKKLLDDALDPVKKDLSSLKSDVSTLKSDVGVLKSDVGTLKSDVGALKSDVGTLKSDVGTLKNDVVTLKDGVTTVKGTVKSLTVTIFELKDIVENRLLPSMTHTEMVLASYADSYQVNQFNIERIDTRLTTVEEKLDIQAPEDLRVPHFTNK